MSRQLTPAQQRLAEEAMALVPAAIAAFLRTHPCLRKAAKLCDLESAAGMAVCQASFTYDPARSKPTTYYGTAIRHALYKEMRKVTSSREGSIERVTMERAEARQKPQREAENTLLRALERMTLEEKWLIEDRILARKSLRSLGQLCGVDPRTVAKRLARHLKTLADRADDMP